jgi:hypothetical protein
MALLATGAPASSILTPEGEEPKATFVAIAASLKRPTNPATARLERRVLWRLTVIPRIAGPFLAPLDPSASLLGSPARCPVTAPDWPP